MGRKITHELDIDFGTSNYLQILIEMGVGMRIFVPNPPHTAQI